MNRLRLLGDTSLRSAIGAGLTLALAPPVFAQDPAPPAAATQQSANEAASTITPAADADAQAEPATIVVTGSRIASPNLASPVPITAINGQEFYKTGEVSVGDKLNELPSIRSTFSSQNSTRFLGTSGLNLLDLRGLGTQRTLVLVNGRRHVAGDILNSGVSVDTNTIPADLIDSVEIVTGGESAVYGSDAIAGVVNFKLKDHFDGLEARAQGGISEYGDAGSYHGSILAGRNFAEDRGNIAVNVEYARQEAYYGSQRPNTQNTNSFVTVDSDPAGSTNGSDGVPDRVFLHNVRSTTIANGGLVSLPTGLCGTGNNGTRFNCTYLFQPDGTLTPQTGTRVGLGPNGSFLGGNGDNLREGKQLVLQPQEERYNINLIGHFEISDAIVPFVEGTYSHTRTTGSTSGPAFFQGSTIDANLERPRLDNPFLSNQARTLITSQILASGINSNTNAALTDDDRAAIADGSYQFKLQKNLLDLGVRNEMFKRETYRLVGGVRGDLGSNWRYEVSANYGEFKESNLIQGNLNVQRFLLAMDSTRNAAGNIVCRSQIDPAAGNAATAGTTSGDIDNRLPADIAACVPLNPFGNGSISDAARNYVVQDTKAFGKIKQFVASGFISGDSSKWFELPGGPIGFSIGAEYRRETNSYTNDPLVKDGYTFYNALPDLTAPAFAVKEAYGELRIPIVKDLPLLQELTISGAGRVADYRGSAGTVFAYNGGIEWRPIRDLMVRGNYSRAVRAPNLSELYSSQSQNFAPGFVDPCSAREIATGTTNRAANCAAAGIPTSYDFVYTESLETISGGNPNLQSEKSDSYTLGAVFTPRFVPGLSLSVDYYNIKVKNVIASVDAQTIANQCYDSATLSNPFCSAFQRNGSGTGPNGEVPYQIIQGTLLESSLNFAKLRARGIDVDFAYRHRFGVVDIGSHLTYTHVLERNDYLDPTDPDFADRGLGELGDPKDSFNWSTDFKFGKFTASYEFRYIGHMFLAAAENIVSVNDAPPQNADFADRAYYPAVYYHNLRLAVDVNDKFNTYLGCDNITNRLPPFGLTGVTAANGFTASDYGGIYDVRGRFFYAGIVAKF